MSERPPFEVSQTVFAQPAAPRPGMMIPHFETIALDKRARALKHPMPHAGAWALAALSMGVGVGATALSLDASNQGVDQTAMNTMWIATAGLLIISLVVWVMRQQTKNLYEKRVDEFCDEIRMLVVRYGGSAADVLAQLEANATTAQRQSIWRRRAVSLAKESA